LSAEQDHEYFMLRAQQERAASKYSATPEGRRVHLELCVRYEEMANALLMKDIDRWSNFWAKRTIR